MLLGQALHLGHVDPVVLFADLVRDDVVQAAGEVDLHAVREVPAVGQVQAHDGVARTDQGVHHGGVGLRAGVRLDVGVLGAEQGLDPVDRELLDHVDVLAAAVVALARVALGVLVGQHRTLRLHDGPGGVVLRGDHFQAVPLAGQLGVDLRGDLRIQGGQLRVQARGDYLLEDSDRACARAHSSPPLASAYSCADSSGPSSVTVTLKSQPAPYGSRVDHCRIADDAVIDFRNLAGDRGVQVRDGLGGLDLTAGLPRGHGGANLGQVHVDDVAQGLGGNSGHTDYGRARAINGDPLVLGGVFQFSGNLGHLCVSLSFGVQW